MTKDELKTRMIEVKKFAQMALDSLDNQDFQKFDVRVDQVEAKLKEAVVAIKEHKEVLEAVKSIPIEVK